MALGVPLKPSWYSSNVRLQRSQSARDRKHRAVAAEDDGEIDRVGQRVVVERRDAAEMREAASLGVRRHLVSTSEQERGKSGERSGDAGTAMATDQRDPMKSFGRAGGHAAIKP